NLRAMNTALSNSVNALTAAGGAPTQGTKLLKLEPFSEERIKLRPFLRQLRVNCATISNKQAHLRYAFALLHDPDLDQILPYVTSDRVNLTNLAALTM